MEITLEQIEKEIKDTQKKLDKLNKKLVNCFRN